MFVYKRGQMATNRYARGKVYKLVNDLDDEIYVGSTCEPLHKRLYTHKQKAKIVPDRHVYKHLLNIGFENVHIVLLENFNCTSKEELLRRERHFIDELKPTLNRCLPLRTDVEWRKENKEVLKEKAKVYRVENAEAIKEKDKARWEHRRDVANARARERREEKGEVYNANRREKRKTDEAYREKCNASQREWREKNREAINARRRELRAQKKAEREVQLANA